MSDSAQQADAAQALSPPWLANDSPPLNGAPMGVGGRFMWNLGLASDSLLEKLNQGVKARMPTVCDVSALPFIGNDRVMTQGPLETTASFRVRLQSAFRAWQHAGESRAVLSQVFSWVSGLLGASGAHPAVLSVGGYLARKWSWFRASDDPTQPPTLFTSPTNNWAWDGKEAVEWWRSWLVLFGYMSAPVLSGSAATIASKAGNFVTLTGLAAVPSTVTSLTLPGWVTISGAATAANNGTFQITQWVSATSVIIAAPPAASTDANNGAISWAVSYFPALQPMPVWGFPGAVWGAAGNTNQAWGVQLPGVPNSLNTPLIVAQLRALVRQWKSAQTWYDRIIVSWVGAGQVPGSAEFTPWGSEGSGNPDGTWASWARRSTGIASLSAFVAFLDGSGYYPAHTNVQVT
jgi:hypothetical protein